MVIAPLPAPAQGRTVRGNWIPQPLRLLAAILYLAVLLAVGAWAINDRLPPPVDLTGLWFWGALLPLTISRLITEPFFSRPADAITNALTVIAATAAIDGSTAMVPADQLALAQWALIGLALTVLALSALAIGFKDLRGRPATVAFQASRVAGVAGRGALLYSLYLLLVSWAAFAMRSEHAAAVGLLWLFVLVAPFERIAFRLPRRTEAPAEVWVEGMLDPRILVVRAGGGTTLRVGAEVSWPSGARGHIVDVTSLLPEPRASVGLLGSAVPATGGAGLIGSPDRDVVGWVGSGTNSAVLKVRFRDEEPGRLPL
jgi:hypothetical protein